MKSSQPAFNSSSWLFSSKLHGIHMIGAKWPLYLLESDLFSTEDMFEDAKVILYRRLPGCNGVRRCLKSEGTAMFDNSKVAGLIFWFESLFGSCWFSPQTCPPSNKERLTTGLKPKTRSVGMTTSRSGGWRERKEEEPISSPQISKVR